MKRNVFETILGGIVLVIAISFLVMAYQKGNVASVDGGYEIVANFSNVDGLQPGTDVRVAGVKIGDLTSLELDPKSFQAVGRLMIDNNVQIPDDTVALITSEGLLGGKYIALEIGGSDKMIAPGGRMQYTQGAANLMDLLGQAIFSKSNTPAAEAPAAPAATAPMPLTGGAEPAHP